MSPAEHAPSCKSMDDSSGPLAVQRQRTQPAHGSPLTCQHRHASMHPISDATVHQIKVCMTSNLASSLRALAHLSALLLQSARALLLPLPAKLRASLGITTGWDLTPLAATKHFCLTGWVAFLYGLDLCAMAPSPPEALRLWLLSTKLYSTANQ